MLVCRHCMEEFRSRGEHFTVTDDIIITLEEAEEMSGTEEADGADLCCEWCGERDDLYGVFFR